MIKFFKKVIKVIFILFLIIFYWIVKASSIPVENVFSDITPSYKYYNELQTLYDKWMIFSDNNWKFNPNSYLTRAEFIGIASEVSCKKCIQPNTDINLINKYKIPPFFDVLKTNKYFYCIAYAKANNFVSGYDINFKCNDWTFREWKKPFCINNNITREEALAVILRMWNILTAKQAENIRQKIKNWVKYPDLSKDVKPILDDWKVYSFYPDFQKALNYKVVDYDKNWNKKILKLIEKKWDYLYPNQPITKQDFLKMAYVALKANNSCIDLKQNNLALKMQVLDKQCSKDNIESCKLSDLKDNDNTFDFNAKIWGICSKWIDSENWYVWRFYNENTWEQIIKKWKFIDNYKFLSYWKWMVFLIVTDNCGNTWEVENTIYIKNKKIEINQDLWLKILADPISWYWPLDVNLDWVVKWWKWPYKYAWDFWDWSKWEAEKLNHIFKKAWIYHVRLNVTDSEWRKTDAMVTINVSQKTKDLNMWLKILADPILWYWPLDVNLDWVVKWWKWPYKYAWDFWDWSKWEAEKLNHIFQNTWVYKVKLKVIDSKWNTVNSYVDINVIKKEYLDVSINATPLIWPWPLSVNLKWLVNWSNGPFTYVWDFWDWSKWEGEKLNHIFKNTWVYKVKLKITDKYWKTWIATVLIKVTKDTNCNIDSDWDWVNDCIDKCPYIKWDSTNFWCPIFDKHCKADCSCQKWYVCWDDNPNTCSSNICKPKPIILSSCLTNFQTNFSWITFGNAVCNSCPCQKNLFLDFISSLRTCDIIFPAITSLDEKNIYGRWNLFQIK